MMCKRRRRPSPHGLVRTAVLALALAGLAACSGSSGNSGSEGEPGPVGPPGPPGGGVGNVAGAEFITATITKVSVPADGKAVVELYLTNQDNLKLVGMPAASMGFVLARLEPAFNGQSSTWRAITRRTEAFPGTPAPNKPEFVTGTGPTNQGYTESATVGTWVDNRDGTYRYTFAKNLLTDDDIAYDGSLVHRVGLEIRTRPAAAPVAIPANNATYTFRPATGELVVSGREIVDNDTCNACHDNLSFHGDARFDLQYCAMCHEAYSADAQTGNSIDLKVMIHKIHRGDLPKGTYGIFGFGNTFQDFTNVAFTQSQLNCQTCHEESDADTPQASNWRLTVNSQACGSCHNNVNFQTGVNHGGVAATEDQCGSCHGPDSSIASGDLRAEAVHFDPFLRAAERFRYEVLNVVDTAPGQRPTVTIRVVDPTNGNAPYDIKAPGGPFQIGNAALRVDVAWSTRPDFTNTGSGSAAAASGTPAQPFSIDFKANGVPDPAFPGGFKATATRAIPAGATGSGSALLEGRPNVDVDGNGSPDAVPVAAAGKAFKITDATPVAYRQVAEIARCNDCHKQLSLHGGNRTGNTELCATCHNPNATDINRRVAGSNCEAVTGTLDDQTIDFKVMVHAIHAGPLANYKVCGFGNSGHDYSHVTYPGKLNNCEGCHRSDPATYYPPEPGVAFATTIDAGPDRSTPLGDVAISPATAVCSACHTGSSARVHMELNGGSFNAIKAADSSIPAAPLETCGTCHGPGRVADVKIVHGIGRFNDSN
jgi:OmcA/MtrC family decaheme c-type cytochrome